MTLPAKLPLKGSQIKAETGLALMKAAGAALGVGVPFKLSALVGKTYGNLIFTPANRQNLTWGYASGLGSVQRNSVGGNFTGFSSLAYFGNQVIMTLNNFKQNSWSVFVKNNGKTYSFTKAPKEANTYVCAGSPGVEFGNLIKASVGKQIICVITPH